MPRDDAGVYYNYAILKLVREGMECAHCRCIFTPTLRQASSAYYGSAKGKLSYCSDACKYAAVGERKRKPPKLYTCEQCGTEFDSKRARRFCTLDCSILHSQADRGVTGNPERSSTVSCLHCGCDIRQKPGRPRRFCTQDHYRRYMAARFDRLIASVSSMRRITGYDEFLCQATLPCLVEGCDWRGHNLTTHMNITHGWRPDEFKRAAGFNLSTGVIGAQLRTDLMAREKVGIALDPDRPHDRAVSVEARTTPEYRRYVSAESVEHRKKSRAI